MTATSQIVQCPTCGAKNRISSEKVEHGLAPLCGRCKTPLNVPAQVYEITDATFTDQVEKSPLPVLVDFWAPWCGPCQMIGPIIDALAKEFVGQVRFAKLNVDQNQRTAARFQASSIPLIVMFKDGKEVDRLVGAYPAPEIRRRLEELLR